MSNAGKFKPMMSKRALLQHVQDGKTDEEIAGIYFCSPSTVHYYRKKYGIGRYVRIYDKGEYERMKELKISDDDICYIWGCGRRQFYNWKSRVGLTKPRNSNL